MLIAEAAEATSSTPTALWPAVISGIVAILVAFVTQWVTGRNKKRIDATSVTEAGIAIVPEMSDKVLEALRRVEELTDAVGRASKSASEAQNEARSAKNEAALARRELAQAKVLIVQLRQERDDAVIERDDYRRRLRMCQEQRLA